MNKITPFLWYDKDLNEKVEYYKGIFPTLDLKNLNVLSDTPSGKVEIADVVIFDQEISMMAAGPEFKLNPSISFSIWSSDKDFLQNVWTYFVKDGKELMPLQKYEFGELYGWCDDKFGLSWQLMYVKDEETRLLPSFMMVGKNAGKASEQMNYYKEVFKGEVEMIEEHHYGANEFGENPEYINFARFSIWGKEYTTMDSGMDHKFSFNESFSFVITTDGQEETDYYWNTFVNDGGEESFCGWCKDKYGVSWQVIPKQLGEAMANPDPAKAAKAQESMLKMKKIIIADL